MSSDYENETWFDAFRTFGKCDHSIGTDTACSDNCTCGYRRTDRLASIADEFDYHRFYGPQHVSDWLEQIGFGCGELPSFDAIREQLKAKTFHHGMPR